jgi:hypothetical protein
MIEVRPVFPPPPPREPASLTAFAKVFSVEHAAQGIRMHNVRPSRRVDRSSKTPNKSIQ